MKRFHVLLPLWMWRWLRWEAASTGERVSTIIRRCIQIQAEAKDPDLFKSVRTGVSGGEL